MPACTLCALLIAWTDAYNSVVNAYVYDAAVGSELNNRTAADGGN